MAYQYFPGATAIGITYNNGVLLASERRISFGNFIVNKNTKKHSLLLIKLGCMCGDGC
jgi:proteasome beta subunit